MKTFLANYKQTLILLASIIIGAIAGIVFGEKVTVLAPFGDLFLNLLLVIIVPLIFLTITTSIAKISQPKRLGKILGTTVLVFIIMSLVAVLVGMLVTYPIKLVNIEYSEKIHTALDTTLEATTETDEDMTLLSRFLSALTVNDFSKLLSRDNLLAIIVFAILFGIAIKTSGEKGKLALDTLESFMNVIMSLLNIVMYYAPIGLGCYFAVLTGTFGASIAIGYAKTFIVYTLVAFAFYFIMYTIYAFIAAGKKGVKAFWKNILPATITSLATCSSAASIPVNIKAARDIGVSDDICETIIPLGTSFHKDGSIIGSVFKVMFLVCIFGTPIYTLGGFMQILLVSLIATLFVAAIPIGGGTISEMMILTMMGYPVYALPILTIIATIIDPPATLLNVVGDSSASMLAARIIDGKNWIDKK
mgnify:FL=1